MRTSFIAAALTALLLSGSLPVLVADAAAANEAPAEGSQPTDKKNPLQDRSQPGVNPAHADNDQKPRQREGMASDHSAGKGTEKKTTPKSDVGPVKWMAPEVTKNDRMSGAQANPLYQESGGEGQNPLHEAK